jgi:eukaryotic-like serine/threonine-protein kinase
MARNAGTHRGVRQVRSQPLEPSQLQGRIPGLEIQSLIGQGGMGAVYRAYQVDLDRAVAVKILPEELAGDPTFVERFRREARALARIDHPNIVRVFGSGVSDGLCYIVMELVEGVTLREAISQKTVDPAAALRIVPQICGALEFAHSSGVVHRDIKPENILLGEGGKVKVADFGLAKLSSMDPGNTALTLTGSPMGTLRYMAPEQFDGADVDHRTDIYALGVVFYELLTGRVPMGHFPPPSETPGVDPRIDAVVMRTLQREPSERYQAVSEVYSDISKIAMGKPFAPVKTAIQTPPTRPEFQGLAEYRQQMMRKGYLMPGREWKSDASFMGYPLLHVAYGFDAKTGKKMVARGVIAIGDIAIGGLALGGVAFGLLSLGGFAVGLTALGGAAIGLLGAYGGGAVGGFAIGGGAIGLLAFGGAAVGAVAMGGGAAGYVAIGGGAQGAQTFDYRGWSDEGIRDSWLMQSLLDPSMPYWLSSGMAFTIFLPLFMVLLALCYGFITSDHSHAKPNPMPADIRATVLRSGGGLIGLAIGLVFIAQMPFQMTRQIRTAVQRVETIKDTQAAEMLHKNRPGTSSPENSP